MQLKINFNIGLVKTNGVKRFHYYRNCFGVEFGCNFIPKRFGLFFWISHAAGAKLITRIST